jgi:ubiquinone/menaquinone biosynthesis C-methylase UbiE
MDRILDLCCGTGSNLEAWGVAPESEVSGVDIDETRLKIAREKHPNRRYLHGDGEQQLAFPDESFDRVICNVALPYMKIGASLAEAERMLVKGGRLSVSLHPLSFVIGELRTRKLRLVPTLFRLYSIVNGCVFHLTGRTFQFVNGRTASFQTEHGIKIALKRAGFGNVSCRREDGRFFVEAVKIGEGSTSYLPAHARSFDIPVGV